jgi:hypothetical protein
MSRIPPFRLLAAALVATPFALGAQTSAALPFHAGQWAIEFSGTQDSGNLGFLRFTSPSSAWLIAPGLVVATGQRDAGGGDEDVSFLGVDLRVGRRGYRALGTSVVSFLGLGLHGQRTSQEEESDAGDFSTRFWSAGVYGELGGSYFFTPRFALGASATAELAYGKENIETGFGSADQSATTFAFPATRVMVTLAF